MVIARHAPLGLALAPLRTSTGRVKACRSAVMTTALAAPGSHRKALLHGRALADVL